MTDAKRRSDPKKNSHKKRVGFLTIGQSPRDDILSDIEPLLSPNIEPVEYGLLDDLRAEEIKSLNPRPQDIPLVSRLRNGRQVKLSEKKISERLPEAVEIMKAKKDVAAVGVLCTYAFPPQKYSYPVIFPTEYIRFIVDKILKEENLGIVVPLETQIEMTRRKWGSRKISVVAKSPYEKVGTWNEIADSLALKKVDTLILDCIGFSRQDRNEIQNLLNIPVLLPRIILVFALNQIF